MDNLGFSSVGGILNAVFTELQNQGPLQAGAGVGAVPGCALSILRAGGSPASQGNPNQCSPPRIT